MVNTEIKFKYPETIEDITVSQYMRWAEVLTKLLEVDEPNLQEIVRHKISIFCNIPVSTIDMIRVDNIIDVSDHLDKILDYEEDLVTAFKIDGKEFRIIPNFENMSFGEFVDANEFLKNPQLYDRLLSLFYREVEKVEYDEFLGIERYRVKPYDPEYSKLIAEKFKPLPANLIKGLTFFLLSSFEILQTKIKDYLKRETMEIIAQYQEKTSTKNGDGSTAYTD